MTKYTEMWEFIENKYKDEYEPLFEEYKKSVNLREVTLIGRAGYGIWVAGELLCAAFIAEGKFAKSIFIMPGERRNTPTRSFIRVADVPVNLPACHIYKPDDMIVAESTFLNFRSEVFDIDIAILTEKMDATGICVLNSAKPPDQVNASFKAKLVTVDASQIALELLGSAFWGNTALLGGYIAATKILPLESMEKVIMGFKDARGRRTFSAKAGEQNIKALRAGYESVKM